MWGRSIVRLCSAQSNRLAQAWVALLVSWFDIFYCNNVVFGLVLQQTAKRFRRCEAMQYSKRQLTGFNSGLRRLPMSIYIAIYSWEHYDQPDKPDGRIPLSELVGNYSCQPGFPTSCQLLSNPKLQIYTNKLATCVSIGNYFQLVFICSLGCGL